MGISSLHILGAFMRTEYTGLINEKFIGQTVTLYGWAHRRRDHGGVIFIDLRDREGLLQIVCDPDTPEVFKTADACPRTSRRHP